MEQLSANFNENVRWFNEVLGVGRSCDLVNRDLVIGGRRARIWVIDGFGGDAILERIGSFWLSISPEAVAGSTGLPLVEASNMIEATSDTGAFIMNSSAQKRLAVKLSKICNDLRLLSSGPRCGLNEINLPPRQPGSSIMPGKVNPVIPEVVNQVAFRVIGNDLTVTIASEAGQLELNVMEPIIVHCLFESIEMLINAMNTLREKCIAGITANEEVCRRMVFNSIGLVTALNPYLGYETSSMLAKEALKTGKGIYDLVLEHKLMSEEELHKVLQPENMVHPRKKIGE